MNYGKAPFVVSNEDSRVRGLFPATGSRALLVETPDRKNERIYCVSCHHPGAYVSNEMIDVVIWLCEAHSPCGCNCTSKGELTLPRVNL